MTWNIGAEETVFQERGALRAQAAGISGIMIAKGAAVVKRAGIFGATEKGRKVRGRAPEMVAQTDVLKAVPAAGMRNVVSIAPRAMKVPRVLSAEKTARAGRIWKP